MILVVEGRELRMFRKTRQIFLYPGFHLVYFCGWFVGLSYAFDV